MTTARRVRPDRDDLVLYSMLVGIGVIPVTIALLERAVFGFDATLGLMMVVVGLVGMLAYRLRQPLS